MSKVKLHAERGQCCARRGRRRYHLQTCPPRVVEVEVEEQVAGRVEEWEFLRVEEPA